MDRKPKIDFHGKNLKDIKETYNKSKDWNKVITTVVYSDVGESQEAFIDFVEEVYKTEVKDAKHLQKLTGITEETLEGLEETLIACRYNKYFRALETALRKGATYKDLLKIEPKEYKLPESWDVDLGKNKQEAILWAINYEFMLGEPMGLTRLPSLRVIAQGIKAPYSVIMDAYNISLTIRTYGATTD